MATIMEILDKKIGNSKKSMTIAEAVGGQYGQTIMHSLEQVSEIDFTENPLDDLAMDFDIGAAVDLLGKVVGDLQDDDVAVSNGKVTGTSKYVTGYTGFSGLESEQEGNYIAFHVSVGELVIGTNVTVKVNGVTMDPDGLHVMRFKDGKKKAKAIIEATATGHPKVSKEFDFTNVVREPKEDEEVSES